MMARFRTFFFTNAKDKRKNLKKFRKKNKNRKKEKRRSRVERKKRAKIPPEMKNFSRRLQVHSQTRSDQMMKNFA
jgi:hypothetical protein